MGVLLEVGRNQGWGGRVERWRGAGSCFVVVRTRVDPRLTNVIFFYTGICSRPDRPTGLHLIKTCTGKSNKVV